MEVLVIYLTSLVEEEKESLDFYREFFSNLCSNWANSLTQCPVYRHFKQSRKKPTLFGYLNSLGNLLSVKYCVILK